VRKDLTFPEGLANGSYRPKGDIRHSDKNPTLKIDPVERVALMKARDPERARLAAIFAAWWDAHPGRAVTAAELDPCVRVPGFVLTRQDSPGKWSPATYALRRASDTAIQRPGLAGSTFPSACPWTCEQVLEKWMSMASPPDSAEVVSFMAAFAKLRVQIDNSPEIIEAEAQGEKMLIDLCEKVFQAATEIEACERGRRELFVAPTNPAFMKAWRDYKTRYEAPVSSVAGWWVLDVPGVRTDKDGKPARIAQSEGKTVPRNSDAASIRAVIEFAASERKIWADHGDFDEEHLNEIDAGVQVWKELVDVAGFDLDTVLRRRWLVPFVRIPRHVSEAHGEKEVLSLLVLLRQAQEAFIYGAEFAALALMRAILELVLKKHYGAKGLNLEILVDDARKLPKGVDRKDLHKLRELGNDVLHFKTAQLKESGRDKIFAAPEGEILSLMAVLRTLIEDAPQEPFFR